MKIFMTGGTGFVGTILTRRLTEKGHQVTVLTRSIRKDRVLPNNASFLEGDPTRRGPWQRKMAEHEIIINLAGTSIFRRWTRKTKRAIADSRILTTRNLVEALSDRTQKDRVFLSTSAVGYYGFRGSEALDEDSPPGDDFLASLTRKWEAEALEAQKIGVRSLVCRFGIVLGLGGGALGKMIPLFNWYLGSPLGTGEQWISWIHEQDLVEAYLFLISKKDICGPVNFTAPRPVTNKEMTEILGEVLNKPTFMPAVPALLLKLVMGEFGSILLEGQRVQPKRLLDMGFHFQFSNIREALENLLKEKKIRAEKREHE
jgi:uncharacterized protein (TIGR01777 family)